MSRRRPDLWFCTGFFDQVEIFVQAARIVRRFAQHLRKIHVVQRQHLADYIEDAIGKSGAHLFEFF
jgi:hypothetical protein